MMADLFNDLPQVSILLVACCIVFFASIIQGALGMGFGLAASPLLALLDPLFVPVPTILIGCLSASLTAWKDREGIHWAEVKVGTVGRLLGTLLAAVVLVFAVEKSLFSLVFGICVATAVAFSLAGWVLPLKPSTVFGMSTVSGLMGTITGVGAPPLAVIYQQQPPAHARPTLAAFFAIGCFISAVMLLAIGWVRAEHLLLFVLLLPAMYLGTLVAHRYVRRIDQQYKKGLLLVAAIASALLIAQGISELYPSTPL